MNVLGVLGCLMEATKEAMLPHAWFEMELLVIIGSSFFFGLLFLLVCSYTAVGVWISGSCFVVLLPPHTSSFSEQKNVCAC